MSNATTAGKDCLAFDLRYVLTRAQWLTSPKIHHLQENASESTTSATMRRSQGVHEAAAVTSCHHHSCKPDRNRLHIIQPSVPRLASSQPPLHHSPLQASISTGGKSSPIDRRNAHRNCPGSFGNLRQERMHRMPPIRVEIGACTNYIRYLSVQSGLAPLACTKRLRLSTVDLRAAMQTHALQTGSRQGL